MSTGHSAAMLCGWGVKAGMRGSFQMWINVWVAGKLCDVSLTHANLSTLHMSIEYITKRYTNVLFTLLTYLLTYLQKQLITGSIERTAKRPYISYSEGDFEVFRPAGETRCSDWVKFSLEEWTYHAKFHPPSVQR